MTGGDVSVVIVVLVVMIVLVISSDYVERQSSSLHLHQCVVLLDLFMCDVVWSVYTTSVCVC